MAAASRFPSSSREQLPIAVGAHAHTFSGSKRGEKNGGETVGVEKRKGKKSGGEQKERVGCWRGYLSGARCRLAYGPADATATHSLLLQ